MDKRLAIFLPPVVTVLLAAVWLVARPPWPGLNPLSLFFHPTTAPRQVENPEIILIATQFAAEVRTPTPAP
jgi:hypothetical protein